jgi:hypothetical protein
MALFAYYKSGLGLFTDDGHGAYEDDAGNVVPEGFLTSQGAKVMRAYKLKDNSWEFAKNDIFASQSTGDNYRFISDTEIKFLIEDFVIQTTYFEEVEYLPEYLVS